MKNKFEHRDGRIYLITTIQIWDGDVVNEYDVTDQMKPIIDDYLDYHLIINDYAHVDGKIIYEGKDKDRYQK